MEDEALESGGKQKVSWWPFLLIAATVFGLWVSSPFLIENFVADRDFQKFGVFGDSFGAVNALFSGLAFTGLFYAILLQRRELELQRKELKDTREVLQSQKLEAEKQNATLAQQTFDNTFFQLLRLHNDIVSAIELRKSSDSTQIIAKGRKCFKIFYDYLENAYTNMTVGMPANNQQELLQRIEKAYSFFFLEYEREVGHYFRSLYNIVKYVDTSHIKDEDKRIYTNLVRAQLSSNELKLLLYNCLSSLGKEKFKPLVERYSLLKSVNAGDLLHGESDAELYDASAFGKNRA